MLSYGDSIADKACNLECIEDLPPVHEFVGPVKIVLMDVPKSIYTKKMWVSALVGLAEMLIGATVFTILFYTLAFKTPLMMNMHVVLCTLGFQLFMPAAILMQNALHGPSAILKQSDRKFQHIFLQVIALLCVGTGASLVMVLAPGKFTSKLTVHCFAGLTSCGLAVLTFLVGPVASCIKKGRGIKNTHAFFGILTFSASSVCCCVALFTSKTFAAWKPLPDLAYILIAFCAIYTIIVVIMPWMKICGTAP